MTLAEGNRRGRGLTHTGLVTEASVIFARGIALALKAAYPLRASVPIECGIHPHLPRVPSLEAFGRRPRCKPRHHNGAVIRNPSQ
jgi:hypothetical protein